MSEFKKCSSTCPASVSLLTLQSIYYAEWAGWLNNCLGQKGNSGSFKHMYIADTQVPVSRAGNKMCIITSVYFEVIYSIYQNVVGVVFSTNA